MNWDENFSTHSRRFQISTYSRFFRGREEPDLVMNNLKKEFPNPVKDELDNSVIKIESDSDDSEIEMVAVVDNKKQKKYKAIKVEEQDDKKQARKF